MPDTPDYRTAAADPYTGQFIPTPEQLQQQQLMAAGLMKAGADYSPIQSPWQGAARLAEGLMGGWEMGQAGRRQAGLTANPPSAPGALAARIAAAYGPGYGVPGYGTPATPAATPATTPAPATPAPGTLAQNYQLYGASRSAAPAVAGGAPATASSSIISPADVAAYKGFSALDPTAGVVPGAPPGAYSVLPRGGLPAAGASTGSPYGDLYPINPPRVAQAAPNPYENQMPWPPGAPEDVPIPPVRPHFATAAPPVRPAMGTTLAPSPDDAWKYISPGANRGGLSALTRAPPGTPVSQAAYTMPAGGYPAPPPMPAGRGGGTPSMMDAQGYASTQPAAAGATPPAQSDPLAPYRAFSALDPNAVANAPGGGQAMPDPRSYPVTQAGQTQFIHDYLVAHGKDPSLALGIARAEGLGAITPQNPAGASSADRLPDGTPFSFGAFQLNVRNGLGNLARANGIDPANPAHANLANKFALDQMMQPGGLRPWRGDHAVNAYQAQGGGWDYGPGGGGPSAYAETGGAGGPAVNAIAAATGAAGGGPGAPGVQSPSPGAPQGRQEDIMALMRVLQDPWASPASQQVAQSMLGTMLPAAPEFKVIGKDLLGNDQYGWVNPRTLQIIPAGQPGGVASMGGPLGAVAPAGAGAGAGGPAVPAVTPASAGGASPAAGAPSPAASAPGTAPAPAVAPPGAQPVAGGGVAREGGQQTSIPEALRNADPIGLTAEGDAWLKQQEAMGGANSYVAQQARAIINGQLPMPEGGPAAKPADIPIRAYVLRAAPSFNEGQANARLDAIKQYGDRSTAGSPGYVAGAANSALGHAGKLWDSSEALAGSQVDRTYLPNTAINWAVNQVRAGPNAVNLKQFNDTKAALAGELGKIYTGGVPGQNEVEHIMEDMSPNQPPSERRAGIQRLIELLQSRTTELDAKWKDLFGQKSDYPLLHSEAQETLAKLRGGKGGAQPAPVPNLGVGESHVDQGTGATIRRVN